MTWQESAQCLVEEQPTGLFFPVGTQGPALKQATEARAVCRRCPVWRRCLLEAVEQGFDGIWGGTDEDERRMLRRRRDARRIRHSSRVA